MTVVDVQPADEEDLGIVDEIFHTLDRFCTELPEVRRTYYPEYTVYKYKDYPFCSMRKMKSGLRVLLCLDYSEVEEPPRWARDVSNTEHWGVGNIELKVNSPERLQTAKDLVDKAFEMAQFSKGSDEAAIDAARDWVDRHTADKE